MNLEKGESSRSVQLNGGKRFTVKNLFKAAETGDVKFLKEALNSHSTEYLLSKKHDEGNCNIIHIAANRLLGDGHHIKLFQLNLLTFIEVALENLPPQAVLSLLCAQEEVYNYTPLHYAALRGWLPAVRLLVDFYTRTLLRIQHASAPRYQSQSEDGQECWRQPWLMKNRFGDTPLHTTLKESARKKGEACALYLMDLDMENLCSSVNLAGHTPLSLAIKLGFNRVTEKVLESRSLYSLTGPDGFNLLHLVTDSSVKVCRLLLDKHPELLRENNNISRWSVLHKWAEVGKLWPLELLLKLNKSSIIEMLQSVDHQGDTPLHVAWMRHKIFFAERLCDIYKQTSKEVPLNLADCSLWAIKDSDGNTPFHLALTNELSDEKVLLKMMAEDPRVLYICNNVGESPLFIAVYNGHEEVVRRILELPDGELIGMPLRGDGCTVLHVMFRCGEKIGQLLVEKFWWLIDCVDSNRKTALQVSELADVLWAKKLLSRWINVPYAIKRPDFDWINASKRGHSSALTAFINHYPNFLRICYERKDTPLHHIELKSLKEYQDFLVNPLIKNMLNMCDHDDATPLHRALEREDILLAELLLTADGVDRSMQAKNNKTASDLLAELCSRYQEWKEMCARIRINPRLRPTYVQPMKTNMTEMRQTLSVVAVLLATLTFAAGFTVPGGFNNDTGEAIMAKKAAFLVFILADTIAMCCSMLALVCLIWSMVCDIPDKSLILVDYSVAILMAALYGTLVAFMTGVFTVISHVSLWAAIVVCIICSLVGISANKTLFFKVLSKLIPAPNQEHRN